MSEHKIVTGLQEAIADAKVAAPFYSALIRARQDPSSVEPGSEMAKLAARMGAGSRIAGLTFGERGADMTPEDIAREINRSIDDVESGKLPTYSTFAEAEGARRRVTIEERWRAGGEELPEHLRWKGEGPMPAKWKADDGTIVYRSYEDYCGD